MSDPIDVVIVGAGQAGLATSHELAKHGISHVVLEKGRVGQAWRGRWESFCLVTPNWSMQLPGQSYDGQDPDAFDPRDEIVGFLERYALRNDTPLREGIEVTSLEPITEGAFRLRTSEGDIEAATVVLSGGAYQKPHRPDAAGSLPADLLQIDVECYAQPSGLPDGPVLVVGSGQSGCQIAEELHESGREVFLACGRAPWTPRRIGDHDLVWWLEESGSSRCPSRRYPPPPACSPISSPAVTTAATTCTCGPCTTRASTCWAISPGLTTAEPDSAPTSHNRSRGAMTAPVS